MLTEHVVLVDEQDQVLGTEEKMKAHELALLHRAFSVFVYRKTKDKISGEELIEFLLQQRHVEKYHCGGLWTNTCCSHPRLNETVREGAERRLKEEMSLVLSLTAVGAFQYKASFENGLTEHEFDHVFIGEYDGVQVIILDPQEVQDYRWISVNELIQELSLHSEQYTPWFKPAFHLVLEGLCLNY